MDVENLEGRMKTMEKKIKMDRSGLTNCILEFLQHEAPGVQVALSMDNVMITFLTNAC